jgi:hypothetical protein
MAKTGQTSTLGVRARLLARLTLFAVGFGAIGVGIFNLFVVPVTPYTAIAPYRVFGAVFTQQAGYFLGDAFIICAGLICVYLASR